MDHMLLDECNALHRWPTLRGNAARHIGRTPDSGLHEHPTSPA
jgi:hypothetical protein